MNTRMRFSGSKILSTKYCQPVNLSTYQPINSSTLQPTTSLHLPPIGHQSIKTYEIILFQVGIQSFGAFFFRPYKMDVALAGVAVDGYAKALPCRQASAGGLYHVNRGDDELPGAWEDGEMRGVAFSIGGAGQYSAALPV